MSRDDTRAAERAKVFGDGDRQCGAFFRVGRGAQLIKQYERISGCRVRDEIYVGHVRRESREVLFYRLIIADIGEHSIEYGQLGVLGRDRDPACDMSANRPTVLSATVLPPVFGPLMMSCRASACSPRSSGTIFADLARRL